MLLRMASARRRSALVEEMGTVWDRMGKFYGEFVYNQGYAMMVYIHEQYGAEKVDELTHQIGSMSFDPAIRRVLGVSADQFYADWVAFLAENYGRPRIRDPRAGSSFRASRWMKSTRVYSNTIPRCRRTAKSWRTSPARSRTMRSRASRSTISKRRKKTKLKGWIDTRIAWSPDGEEIVFVRNKGGFNDLYIYNLAEDKERRISARLRAKDPSFSFPDGQRIAFVTQ